MKNAEDKFSCVLLCRKLKLFWKVSKAALKFKTKQKVSRISSFKINEEVLHPKTQRINSPHVKRTAIFYPVPYPSLSLSLISITRDAQPNIYKLNFENFKNFQLFLFDFSEIQPH